MDWTATIAVDYDQTYTHTSESWFYVWKETFVNHGPTHSMKCTSGEYFLNLASSNLIGWFYETSGKKFFFPPGNKFALRRNQADTANTLKNEIITGFAQVFQVSDQRYCTTI